MDHDVAYAEKSVAAAVRSPMAFGIEDGNDRLATGTYTGLLCLEVLKR
jgi:hypothetical protein